MTHAPEAGVYSPDQRRTLPPLTAAQQHLRDCFLSGQITPRVWIEHLEADPVLKAHFGSRPTMDRVEAVDAFRQRLAEVNETERTNTRNSGTDWNCRQFFVEHGDVALRALEEAQAAEREQMAGWQPIETAPKDGTPVMLWAPDYRDYAAVGEWCDRVGAWDADCGMMEEGPAVAADECSGPTHWRPLPAAPALSGASS